MTSTRAVLAAATILLAGALAAAPIQAQVPRPSSWTLTGAAEVLRAGDRSWGFGPRLSIRYDVRSRWGVELTAALPAFGSSGGGAAVDLAATYTVLHGPTEVGATLGATAFLVGDQSELVGGGVGVMAGGHVTQWVAPGLGLTAGVNLRTAIGAYPAAHAGLTVRF